MNMRREVDIILLVLFIVLFFGLGSYIGIKDQNGEKVMDIDTNYVWEPASTAIDIFPKINYSPKEKEPIVEMPSIIIEEKEKIKIIEIKDTKYYPAELNITKGTTVYWVNKDAKRNYQVYEKSSAQTFNSFQIIPFENFSYTFDEEGVFKFGDAIFTFMHGIVRVN